MADVAQSDHMHARAQSFMRSAIAGAPHESYESLALALARYQATQSEAYARLCRSRAVAWQTHDRAADFPAVPSDAFKQLRVGTLSEAEATQCFRTSGTTVGDRGSHYFRRTDSYECGALLWGERSLRLSPRRFPIVVLGPSREALPDSSLTHMFELFVAEWGSLPRSEAFFLRGEQLDVARLGRVVRQLQEPALVCGASFAFVHLIDELSGGSLPLPAGSRVMQTGGFKGRSRVVDARTLKETIATTFCVPQTAVTSEYGMTELSSQFYEVATNDRGLPVYKASPWTRVIAVDPSTLNPVADGDEGIARIEDLANVDSAWAIVVPDRVRRVGDGFELIGRVDSATPRGCSIAIDEIVGRNR